MGEQPPSPDENFLCWDAYLMLQTTPNELDVNVVEKAKKPLTWEELDCYDFHDESDACLAYIRAQGLVDSVSHCEALYTSKAYLLMGRSALWLARDAHIRNSIPPKGIREELINAQGSSLAKFVQECISKAILDPAAKSIALTLLARIVVGQVASDTGKHARPAMAEGWLVAAEVEVMLAELEAAMGAGDASGIRPSGRLGPWREQDDEDDDDNICWSVSIPGKQQPINDKHMTFLANYWWGQSEETALIILGSMLLNALKHLFRYKPLSDKHTRKHMWKRENGLEREIYCRGSAALSNLDAVCTPANRRKFVENLRNFFPGSPFEPSEEFVRSLKKNSDAYPTIDRGDENIGVWNITCMLGLGGSTNQTVITVMDTEPGSRWMDMIMAQKILSGNAEKEHYSPTSQDLYQVLLSAMAGAGDETRAYVGPPRRPAVVQVSYRLRNAFPELSKLLQRIDVECVLDTEESLRFACATNLTDFETGAPLKEDDPVEQTLIGQLVGVCGLVNRSELNGRVGRIVRWHEDQERWEINLECFAPGERKRRIAIRPTNLMACPQQFTQVDDYLRYVDAVRDTDPDTSSIDSFHVAGPVLDKLRATDISCTDDSICAICQQNIKQASKRCNGFGHGTRLPCGHSFHLSCIVPWITIEKAECPCCRARF